MLIHSRNIYVYETDLMGIVHHSNYLRFCEEARIEWCRRFIENKNLDENSEFLNQHVYSLTVVSTKVHHKLPLKYPNQFAIDMQSQIDGIRLVFLYKIKNNVGEICAEVETVHCSVNEKLRPLRLSKDLVAAVQKQNM